MKEYTVKILSTNVQNENNNAAIYTKDLKDVEDLALFHSWAYSNIFSVTRRTTSMERKLLSIVKIKYNGRKIYRRMQSSRFVSGIGKGEVGLSPSSISLLADITHSVVGEKVKISRGSKFMYYWFHPFHATRVSFRVGLPSLLLSALATVLSIISLC